ncbi:MAG: glycosyltransferase [Candidatus Roizmanbacteria bacterium]
MITNKTMNIVILMIIIIIIIVIMITIMIMMEDISTDQNCKSQILYSYGLFSKEPMSDVMLANIKHNHEVTKLPHLVLGVSEVYDDLKQVESELPGIIEAYEMVPRGVAKSDLARIVSLYVRGGHYADLDVVFRKIPPIRSDYVILYTETFSVKLSDRHITRIANYGLSSPAKHPFLKAILIETIKRINQMKNVAVWSDEDVLNTTGPDVITTIYHEVKMPKVRRIGFWRSRQILSHNCAGSWRAHKDNGKS